VMILRAYIPMVIMKYEEEDGSSETGCSQHPRGEIADFCGAVVLDTGSYATWEINPRKQAFRWRDWLVGIRTQIRFYRHQRKANGRRSFRRTYTEVSMDTVC